MPEPINPHPRTPTVLISIESPAAQLMRHAAGSLLYGFDNRRDALAAADARGSQAALQISPSQLEHQRQQQAGSGHAEWMSQRNRAAVHVDLVAIEAQLLLDRQILRRKGFVHLDQIDVLQ